jgi:hypothetical protein
LIYELGPCITSSTGVGFFSRSTIVIPSSAGSAHQPPAHRCMQHCARTAADASYARERERGASVEAATAATDAADGCNIALGQQCCKAMPPTPASVNAEPRRRQQRQRRRRRSRTWTEATQASPPKRPFRTLIILYALSFWVAECTPNPGRSFPHSPMSMVSDEEATSDKFVGRGGGRAWSATT